MFQYIPFIHKIVKKEKKQPEQVSLYIEDIIPENKKTEEKETEQPIIVIELF